MSSGEGALAYMNFIEVVVMSLQGSISSSPKVLGF